MPLNPRVRDNNVFGLTTDDPLTAAATSVNSSGLSNLSPVSSQHAILTLDPLRQYGNPEIIVVTAHTSSSTVATVLRGQYGTSARLHPQGTLFVHAPLDADFIEIASSITRPSDPYEGQFIYEADTNKLVGYGGTDWAPRDAGGQIGYAQIVVGQSVGTTEIDITGLSTTVTVGTGRRIKISGEVFFLNDATAGQAAFKIYEGGIVTLQDRPTAMGASENSSVHASVVITPSAGPHTYKIRAVKFINGGTVTFGASATQPAYILVEDIGAA